MDLHYIIVTDFNSLDLIQSQTGFVQVIRGSVINILLLNCIIRVTDLIYPDIQQQFIVNTTYTDIVISEIV